MKRIICFGGSFNPPHTAHLKIALSALRQMNAYELWFIPSMDNPFKSDETAFEVRCQLVEDLIKPYRRLKVLRLEAELPTPSYTIHTVLELKKRYPDIEFMWLIGSDQALQLNQWYESQKLQSEIQFIVYPRDEKFTSLPGFKVLKSSTIYPISSTQVREGDLSLVPKCVLKSMVDHEVYLESIASSLYSEKRFNHVKAVTELALELGSAHDLDLHVLYIAALFHDCAKDWTRDESQQWLSAIHPTYLSENEALWHQILGAYWVKRNLAIHDQRILHAISHHVQGDPYKQYTQVIYIADKCDKTRGYDASELISIAMKDLKKGYEAVHKHQRAYLIKEGVLRE